MSYFPEEFKTGGDGSANYVKIKEGEYRFRLLSTPIVGWLDWTFERKPLRFRYNSKPKPINADNPVREFIAMIVWDYKDEAIKIWEVTQKRVMSALRELSLSPDWGCPCFYDIKVVRKGTELANTVYTILPVPHKPTHPQIEEEFHKKPCNLDAFFTGEDPWNIAIHDTFIKGIFVPEDMKVCSQENDNKLLDELSSRLQKNNIDPTKIGIYVGQKAAEKRRTIAEVVESALHTEFFGSFMGAYRKWLGQDHALEEEAIPF